MRPRAFSGIRCRCPGRLPRAWTPAAPDAHHDLAAGGELDRVRHQVHDHLANVLGVRGHVRGRAGFTASRIPSCLRSASGRRFSIASPIVAGSRIASCSGFAFASSRRDRSRTASVAQQLVGAAANPGQRTREPLGRHARRILEQPPPATRSPPAASAARGWRAEKRRLRGVGGLRLGLGAAQVGGGEHELTDEDVHAVADRVQLVLADEIGICRFRSPPIIASSARDDSRRRGFSPRSALRGSLSFAKPCQRFGLLREEPRGDARPRNLQ